MQHKPSKSVEQIRGYTKAYLLHLGVLGAAWIALQRAHKPLIPGATPVLTTALGLLWLASGWSVSSFPTAR